MGVVMAKNIMIFLDWLFYFQIFFLWSSLLLIKVNLEFWNTLLFGEREEATDWD